MLTATESPKVFKENYIPEQKNRYPNGRHARFMNLENGWGIKFYELSHHRDHALYRQGKAAEHGLGPEVGPEFEVEVAGETFYCYVTEFAEEIEWVDPDTLYGDEEVQDLQDSLENIGVDIDLWELCHHRNLSRTDFGDLICIDFGY